jgi:CHAT domain-containing protein
MLRSDKLFYLLFISCLFYLPSSSGSQEPSWMKPAALADSLQEQKEYGKAFEYWEKAYSLAKKEPDSVKKYLLFRQLYAKGAGYNYESEGIPYFEKAHSLLAYSRLDVSGQSTFLNTYYHFLGYNDRWEEALPLAEQCAQLRKTLNEDPPAAYLSAVHDVAYIHNKLGNYPEAIENYHLSIAGYTKHQASMANDVALGYNNLAFNYSEMGMANQSYKYYTKAAQVWSGIALVDNSYLMTVYGNLLRWQKLYGDHVAMEGLLAKIREIVEHKSQDWGTKNKLIADKKDHKDPLLPLTYWKCSMDYYQAKSDAVGVRTYLDSTRHFIRDLQGQPSNKILDYLNNAYSVLGEVYAEVGDHRAALGIYQDGLDQMTKYGYSGKLAHNYARMAKSMMALGLLDDAELYLQKAFGENKSRADLSSFHTLAADLAEKRQQPDSVRFHVRKTMEALSGLEELNDDYSSLSTASFAGRVTANYIAILSANGHHLLRIYKYSNRRDDLLNAKKLFSLALDMLDTYYLGGPYTDALADMQSAIHYGWLACQTLLPRSPETRMEVSDLFERLENNRSQHRWKKFIKNAPSNSTTVPDSLREAEEEQRQLLVFYKKQLKKAQADSTGTKKVNQARAKIHECEVALGEIEEQILAVNERYMALSQGRVTTKVLQKQLPRDATLLRYMLTDSGAYVMRVDRSTIQLFPLGSTDSIDSLVQVASRQLRTRSVDFYATARQLHRRLLGSEIAKGLKRHLIIIPDGSLYQIPFEALTSSGAPDDFLLRTHTISYATSTALWLAQKGLRHKQKRPLGAFSPRYIGGEDEERSGSAQRLAGATREAETIAKMLGGNVYQQNHFGKQDFLDVAPNYNLLHLAMHADVQEEDGESSSFQFGDGSKLYAYELYGMKLQSNMVVLSACNTGYGPLQKGEGAQSLAMAFTYAGVPSLVMGLWSLPDASTSGIMVDYYRQLVDHKQKHAALATAKVKYLERTASDAELQHPFYWAGLVISGDTAPIKTPVVWWYWAVGVSVLALTAWGIKSRKKHVRSQALKTA